LTTLLTDKFCRSKEKHIQNHPYRWTTDQWTLDAATLEEFQASTKKFYMPNNAVLVVAGDFKTEEAKQWIKKYFGSNQKDQL
jgi:predicted Zn-dependent peptidase